MRVPIRAPAAEKRVTASGSHWFSMGETAPSMQSVMVNSLNTVTFALQRRLFHARATRTSPVDSSRARNGRIACSSCLNSSYVQAAGCAACGPSTTCAQRSAYAFACQLNAASPSAMRRVSGLSAGTSRCERNVTIRPSPSGNSRTHPPTVASG